MITGIRNVKVPDAFSLAMCYSILVNKNTQIERRFQL